MNKEDAIDIAIEVAKVALSGARPTYTPEKAAANGIADFIETLADRLVKMYDGE